jgi:DNA-directed RNA polymerase subunit N (RpoN/RPB10)
MTYQEQIKSPKWQKKRLEILNLRGFKCEKCSNEEKQLHVHHGAYIIGNKVWDYEESSLHTLCYSCHSVISDDINYYNHALSKMGQVHENYEILTELVEKISIISDDDKINLSEYIKSIPY